MRGRRTVLVGAAAALVAGGLVMAAPLGAHAANTYTVITNLDTPSATCGTAAKTGSLRDCIAAANAAGGTNTITFGPAVVLPIVLTMGEIDITGSQTLTITGSGQSSTIIDGNSASRVFGISSGATVSMTDLTIQNGKVTNDSGGGIRLGGNLSLTHVTMSGNQAVGTGVGASGGAIYFTGTGTMNLTSSTFSGNTASSTTDGDGGAFQDCCSGLANTVITNSTFNNNTATTTTGQAYGGAIDSHSTIHITGSTFSGNTASQTSSTSTGGTGASAINTHGTLVIDSSTFHANSTTAANPARGGSGAILVCCGGGTPTITLTHSTLDHNTVTGNAGPTAAALSVCCGSAGSIDSSTFASNSATGADAEAGAIEIDSSTGKAAFPITNSTITGNSVNGANAIGGGLVVAIDNSTPVPAVNLVNDTIDANAATLTGANLYIARDGVVTALNTIIAGTPASNCSIQAGGVLTDNGHNLDDAATSTCGFTAAKSDVLGADPKLGGLADNGGPTQTQALQSASPAIDGGTNTGCPATDQRGITRVTVTDTTCDIGGFEFQKTTTVTPAGPLPDTGAGLALPLAALLVLWGVGALAVGRRRPSRRTDS